MLRVETTLLVVSGFVWTLSLGVVGGFVPLSGLLSIDLYRYYSVAAVLGWLSGNVYMLRRRSITPTDDPTRAAPPPVGPVFRHPRRLLLMVYGLGPPSVVMLLWALSPRTLQLSAPLVPIYALMIFGLFFLVPVTLGGGRPRRPRIGS